MTGKSPRAVRNGSPGLITPRRTPPESRLRRPPAPTASVMAQGGQAAQRPGRCRLLVAVHSCGLRRSSPVAAVTPVCVGHVWFREAFGGVHRWPSSWLCPEQDHPRPKPRASRGLRARLWARPQRQGLLADWAHFSANASAMGECRGFDGFRNMLLVLPGGLLLAHRRCFNC